jgi:CubicO group peptidase (beta-lactamase class C family)
MTLDLGPVAKSLLDLGGADAHPAGAVVGLRVDGAVAVAAKGWAVLPGERVPGRPMTTETVLDLASVTKMASTTAIAMALVGSGSLELDTPVAEHLSGLPGGRDVTVRHLLAHTSGLPPWSPLYCATTDRQEALALAAGTTRVAEPGTTWSYSDLGLITLGSVLEAVGGQRQDELFASLVARPLGLAHTAYGPVDPATAAASADSDVVEHEMVRTGQPYPTEHTVDDFDGWRDAPAVGVANDGNAAHALGGVAGHAGLFSTVPELLRIGSWLVDRDRHGEVLREFTTPLEVAPQRGLGFRLAHLDLDGERVPVVLHPGFTGTVLAAALDRDLVVAAAATRLHGTTGGLGSPRRTRDSLVPVEQVVATTLSGVAAAIARGGSVPAQEGAR